MNGSGCKNCPVNSCETNYRGSTCAAQRVKFGLGDPQTNADRIRAMSDEGLAKEFADCAIGLYCDTRKKGLPELPESVKREAFDIMLEWLIQPADQPK